MRLRSVGTLAALLTLALAVLLTAGSAEARQTPAAPSLAYAAGPTTPAETERAHPGDGSGNETGLWRAQVSHRGGTAQPRKQVRTTAPLGNSPGGTGVDVCTGPPDRRPQVTTRGSGRQVGTLLQVFRH
ncbi:hypothetical protein AF335_27665 [Streptomyces eurocidicus]|uniref:Uncharacterized protein n=1 Tax=Streptomyces eurocidicus TaxID=66423 RepID=A0A2N8NP93_STREU|nr:hypothetical protein [Streptomyces eurocidicus]PNE30592.1 hypothetical protein AF335_27665 [Streptomyces eurocidicus]